MPQLMCHKSSPRYQILLERESARDQIQKVRTLAFPFRALLSFLRVLRHFGLFNTMQAYQGLLRVIKLQLMVVRTLLGRVVRCCPP